MKHRYEFMNRRSRAYQMGAMVEYERTAARTNSVGAFEGELYCERCKINVLAASMWTGIASLRGTLALLRSFLTGDVALEGANREW
jgi:hypothetical protein